MSEQERQDLIECWYRQYTPLLFRYACQFVDYHQAEEVVQETFRIAWETLRRTEIHFPKTWLRKTAENVVRNRVRQQERQRRLLTGAEGEEDLGRTEDPVDIELEYDGLIRRRDLHLLKLLAVDGYTYAEAARELGISAEACRKRAKRAQQALRELLEK